jgi:hypothetical protein
MWIRHDVYQGYSIKSDHLLEVNKASVITVNIFDRDTIICSVPVGLEDVAPEWTWRLRHRHVQEDRVCTGLQNSIRLEVLFNVSEGRERCMIGTCMRFGMHTGWELALRERSSIQRYLEIQTLPVRQVLYNVGE